MLIIAVLVLMTVILFTGCKEDNKDGENEIKLPIITSFAPAEAAHGATLTITGNNFSAVLPENSVTLNGVAAMVISASATEIKVTVPKNLLLVGFVEVSVGSKTTVSAENFIYLPTVKEVITLAGNGTMGSNNGTSAVARFYDPQGISVDATGNIYVADTHNLRIRKITPEGMVSTLAGYGTIGFVDGSGAEAKFSQPKGITIDIMGNLYVADCDNNCIRKVSPEGMVSTLAGGTSGFADGSGTEAKFRFPRDIAMDVTGNIYVADTENHRIRKITSTGMVSTLAGSEMVGFRDGTGAEARFYFPNGIAIDETGNIYVADAGNHRIRKITPEGVVSTLTGNGIQGFADGVPATAKFNSPHGIKIDVTGNIYVADTENHRIRKITPEGRVSTLAGSGTAGFADGSGAEAQFKNPYGIAVDAVGNVYVADTENHRIRKIVVE